ncbi:hypothetical protein Tco_1186827, partial [Tanacetum coccineum]
MVMRLWRVVVLGVGDGGSWCSGDELEVAAVVASGWWRWRRQDKWKCILTRLIDDLLALDSKVRFDISDQRLELTATFSIPTNSAGKGCALHHWVHDVRLQCQQQLVISDSIWIDAVSALSV